MKKIVIPLLLLVLLAVSVSAASITFERTINASSVLTDVGADWDLDVADGKLIFSDANDLLVYRLSDGVNLWDSSTAGVGEYVAGYYFLCYGDLNVPAHGICNALDMSVEGFYSLTGADSFYNQAGGVPFIISAEGGVITAMVDRAGNSGYGFTLVSYNVNTGLVTNNITGNSTDGVGAYPIIVDRFNDFIIMRDGEVINISDAENPKLIDTLTVGDPLVGDLGGDSPKVLTDENKIVDLSDLNNIRESAIGFNASLIPKAYLNDRSIYATDGSYWFVVDFSNVLDPVVSSTGVPYVGEMGDSFTASTYDQYYSSNNNDGDYIVTLDYDTKVFYVYSLSIEDTCLASNGCLLNDSFEYEGSVLDHGWLGSDSPPVDGSLYCYPSVGYLTQTKYFTPITSDAGSAVFDMDFNYCDDVSNGELFVGFGNKQRDVGALYVVLKPDGNIYGNPSTSDTNPVVGSFSPNCSADRVAENLKIVLQLQNSPNTYSVYVNDVEQSRGNSFSDEGSTLTSLDTLYLTSNFIPDYCNWTIESVSISYEPSPSVANGTQTFGSFILPSDGESGSFDDSRCRADEQKTWCFLRVMVGDVLNWFLDLIINNVLLFAAFIVIVMLVLVMKKKVS